MAMKANKPIYGYGVVCDAVEETVGQKGPRKLSREIRSAAVRKAIEQWIANNPVDPSIERLSFKFVMDSNGSAVYTLFDMPISSDRETNKSLTINIKLPVPEIILKKQQLVEREFCVKFSGGGVINVKELMDYCMGKSRKNYKELQESIRALNTILHGEIATVPNLILSQSRSSGIGSVFKYERKEQFEISKGIFCNRGTIPSVRLTEEGIVVNVANTVAPFYEPMLLTQFIKDRYRVSDFSKGMSAFQIDALRRDLKNKQVEVLHINYGTKEKPHYKKYRVHDVQGSAKDTFKTKDKAGNEIVTTIEQYFAKEYSKLKFPNLPCIVDNGRKLPLELCRIVDKQRVARKLDPEETSNVIRQAALKPERHFQLVNENVNLIKQNSQSLKDFGMELDCKPIEVEGRELPPVSLICGGNRPVLAREGQYNIQRDRFLMPAKVSQWRLLVLIDNFAARDGKDIGKNGSIFAERYCNEARSKGVSINSMAGVDYIPPAPPKTIDSMPEPELKRMLYNQFCDYNKQKVDFVVVLLPDRPDWLYGYLQYLETHQDVRKTRGPNELSTRTSCIKYNNYMRKIVQDSRGGQMFLGNLWLKHNVKLGGVNVALQPNQNFSIQGGPNVNFLADGFLFLSIDVCHPAPGDRFMQSVAAMVGMWDLTSARISHTTRLRVQAKQRSKNDLSTVEEVGDVGLLFEEILNSFKSKKGRMPSHLVVLRDGVSEGQFQMVLEFELQKIKSVLDRLSKGTKLACLTIQKRHRVRFMRKQPVTTRKGDQDYNIQPGTVVDSKITHPNDFTFYLAPHKALQGTAKAPCVYMIYDNIGFDMDSAQAMIHALSCLSPRCTKLTSIPTPINLADLAAERGKHIIIAWSSHQPNLAKMQQDELLAKLNSHLARLGEDNYKNTMYYS